jgi:hypothetical protein
VNVVSYALGASKRKADVQSINPAKKGSHAVDGVRKAHHEWRVGISADIPVMKQSRPTVPFDYSTEDANKVYWFICCSMAATEPDPKVCDLDSTIVEQL